MRSKSVHCSVCFSDLNEILSRDTKGQKYLCRIKVKINDHVTCHWIDINSDFPKFLATNLRLISVQSYLCALCILLTRIRL